MSRMCVLPPSTAISAKQRISKLSWAACRERKPAPTRMADAGSTVDRRFMAAAIRLGAGALGTTRPNPAVGAILVKGGKVVGRGRTAPGGRPHAEQVALAQAGGSPAGATA